MKWKIIMLLLLVACTQQPLVDSDEEFREQALIQDLLEDNARLRAQKGIFEELVNSSDMAITGSEKTKQLLKEYKGLELPNPRERIPVESISVQESGLYIDFAGIFPGKIADTNSMDPLFDADSKVLVIAPIDERDIALGDIIVYGCAECDDKKIIHRVVGVGRDMEGAFFLLKGDNSPITDPYRVRFDQIEWIVVGIIY